MVLIQMLQEYSYRKDCRMQTSLVPHCHAGYGTADLRQSNSVKGLPTACFQLKEKGTYGASGCFYCAARKYTGTISVFAKIL